MAYDKLIDSAQLNGALTATADAIRAKTEMEDLVLWDMNTGFSSTIQNMSTGGADLNFEVVGGTTQPANPKENTIWVNTATDITAWSFSTDAPADPVEGMVWLQTDRDSALAFNALKKNTLEAYPVLASQYISGAFVQKDILLYQDGTWKSSVLVLYDNGDQCLATSGGWTGYKIYSGSANPNGETSMNIVGANNGYQFGALMNKTAIDFTPFTKLCFDVTVNTLTSVRCTCGYSTKGVTGSGNEISMNIAGQVTIPGNVGRTEKYLDISTVTGSHYVAIQSGDSVSIHKVWLE